MENKRKHKLVRMKRLLKINVNTATKQPEEPTTTIKER